MEALVQQQYDRLAGIYDRRWQFYITNTLSFLADWARISAQEQVLDVACGTGEFERLLVERHPNQAVTGVDFSGQMLAIARSKFATAPNVHFRQAAAASLPFPDSQFGVITCANAFHYFDEPDAALTEMARVLRPGGRVMILDWCRDFLVCRICDQVLGWLDPAHQRCYSEAELRGFLTTAGYRIVRSRRVRFGLIWGLMAVEAIVESRGEK